ncbi:MAG: hypothetical protein M3455_07040, partial [Actinomycetota bacterium]|nr:hypothetical protein [Actinomycetota bacterium]
MPSRRRSITALLLAPVVVGLIGIGPVAGADPASPSEREVSDAYRAAETAAEKVGRLEAGLARAAGELADLQVAASKAVEAFHGAEIALAAARESAAATRRELETATQTADAARFSLGQFAAEIYRNGGALATSTMVLDAKGPAGLLDRLVLIGALSHDYEAALDRHRATAIAADLYAGRAGKALAVEEASAAVAQDARDTAEAAVQTQVSETDRLTARRASLVSELAAARGTAVSIEQARQDALAAEAAANPPVVPPGDPEPPAPEPTASPTSPPIEPPS